MYEQKVKAVYESNQNFRWKSLFYENGFCEKLLKVSPFGSKIHKFYGPSDPTLVSSRFLLLLSDFRLFIRYDSRYDRREDKTEPNKLTDGFNGKPLNSRTRRIRL